MRNNGYQYDGSLALGALHNQFAYGDQPPSTYAITAWVNGEPGGFTKALGVTTLRTVPIAAGVWAGTKAFGPKSLDPKSLWGIAGAVSVTLTLMIAGSKVWGKVRPSAEATEKSLGRFRRKA